MKHLNFGVSVSLNPRAQLALKIWGPTAYITDCSKIEVGEIKSSGIDAIIVAIGIPSIRGDQDITVDSSTILIVE
jgi:hypothetical protein